MSPLETMLAVALASAVNAECNWFAENRKVNDLPAWFQDAVWTLAEYDRQNQPVQRY
jgi:hypothetical protein